MLTCGVTQSDFPAIVKVKYQFTKPSFPTVAIESTIVCRPEKKNGFLVILLHVVSMNRGHVL